MMTIVKPRAIPRSCGHTFWLPLIFAAAGILIAAAPASSSGTDNSFNNPTTIALGPNLASPFPSSIQVSGVAGNVERVTVTLNNLSYTTPEALQILLVSASGKTVLLMGGAGGTNAISGIDLSFDDSGPALPDSGQIFSGTYKPTNYRSSTQFSGNVPAPPYGGQLNVFNGPASEENGQWNLYMEQNCSPSQGANCSTSILDSGSIVDGWTLNIQTDVGSAFIATAHAGGTPKVSIFDAAKGTPPLLTFLAYESTFTGGVRLATGDVNGDSVEDLIVGPGPGRSPLIKIFDGASLLAGQKVEILPEFLAFKASFQGGVYVSATDVNGDGKADVIVGAGAGGPPEVRVFDGATRQRLFLPSGDPFFVFALSFTKGVSVAGGRVCSGSCYLK